MRRSEDSPTLFAGTQLYVSRGLGGIELPIRAFAPPEVAIFDFVARPLRPDVA